MRESLGNIGVSLIAHISIVGIALFISLIANWQGPIVAVESDILSMDLVDAGSGSGTVGERGEAAALEQQAAAPDPKETVIEEPQEIVPKTRPSPPDENAVTIKQKKKKKKPPREKPKKAPPKAKPIKRNEHINNATLLGKKYLKTGGDAEYTSAGKANQASGGDGKGIGTGRGNANSPDGGQGDGRAQQTALSYLRAMVQRYKRYPPKARNAGIEGVIRIRFTIDANGMLASAQRVSEDGPESLRVAADEMIARIQDNWRKQKVEKPVSAIVPVRYSLKRN